MQHGRFETVRQAYARRRSRLILEGKSQRRTGRGYWAMSDPLQLFELFRKLNLQEHKSFVDLGSGDGVVVAVASLFTKAAGIESDERLHRDAEEIRQRLGMDFTLKNMDYLEEDLSRYDFIFINPDNYFHKLEKRLVEGFKGKIVIVENIFRPLTLRPERSVSVMGTSYSIYKI